jgi:hypothetical protein
MSSMQSLRFSVQLGCVILLMVAWAIRNNVRSVAQSNSAPTYVADQVVVKINPVSGATIEQINAAYGTKTLRPLVRIAGVYQIWPGQWLRIRACFMRTPTGAVR